MRQERAISTTAWITITSVFIISACSGADGAADEQQTQGGSADEGLMSDSGEPVDVRVENGVAPYDAATAVDNEVLGFAIARIINRAIGECVREQGFTEEPPEPQLPTREEAIWGFNAEFPYIEGLSRDGLKVMEPDETGPDGELPVGVSVPSEGYLEAHAACFEEMPEGDAIHPAQERLASLRQAWQVDVLDEIEGEDEILELSDVFSQCLIDEGIPSAATTDEESFLFHVDDLMFEAGEDSGRIAQIAEEYGQLYIVCGEELFEARERLRGGDRRTAFLAEHRDEIRELTELLRGEGVL